MTTEKTVLQKALEHLIEDGALDSELRPYSGRGMHGKECLAINCSLELSDAVWMTQHVINTMGLDSLPELIRQMDNTQRDQLGKSDITYWSGVPFVEGD